jgi:hypothetical protein
MWVGNQSVEGRGVTDEDVEGEAGWFVIFLSNLG